jgi:hypothetical protein
MSAWKAILFRSLLTAAAVFAIQSATGYVQIYPAQVSVGLIPYVLSHKNRILIKKGHTKNITYYAYYNYRRLRNPAKAMNRNKNILNTGQLVKMLYNRENEENILGAVVKNEKT